MSHQVLISQSCNVKIIRIPHSRCGTGSLMRVLNPFALTLTHAEFRDAFNAGKISVQVDPAAAAKYLSARLLLPFVMLPVLGVGVALALSGWIWTGLAVLTIGIVAPRLIKRSAPHFVLTHALEDKGVYEEATRTNLLRVTPVT